MKDENQILGSQEPENLKDKLLKQAGEDKKIKRIIEGKSGDTTAVGKRNILNGIEEILLCELHESKYTKWKGYGNGIAIKHSRTPAGEIGFSMIRDDNVEDKIFIFDPNNPNFIDWSTYNEGIVLQRSKTIFTLYPEDGEPEEIDLTRLDFQDYTEWVGGLGGIIIRNGECLQEAQNGFSMCLYNEMDYGEFDEWNCFGKDVLVRKGDDIFAYLVKGDLACTRLLLYKRRKHDRDHAYMYKKDGHGFIEPVRNAKPSGPHGIGVNIEDCNIYGGYKNGLIVREVDGGFSKFMAYPAEEGAEPILVYGPRILNEFDEWMPYGNGIILRKGEKFFAYKILEKEDERTE